MLLVSRSLAKTIPTAGFALENYIDLLDQVCTGSCHDPGHSQRLPSNFSSLVRLSDDCWIFLLTAFGRFWINLGSTSDRLWVDFKLTNIQVLDGI